MPPKPKPTTDDVLRILLEKVDHFGQEIVELKGKFQLLPGLTKAIGVVQEQLEDINQKIEASVATMVEEKVMEEVFDMERKRDELVIYDIQEPTNSTGPERQKADHRVAVTKLNKYCPGLKADDIEFVRRLGKFNGKENKDKPRPLLVGFFETERRNQAVGRARRSKDPTVKPSLTQSQKQYISGLYQQRDAKNKNEVDDYKWIISGPPGKQILRRVRKKGD